MSARTSLSSYSPPPTAERQASALERIAAALETLAAGGDRAVLVAEENTVTYPDWLTLVEVKPGAPRPVVTFERGGTEITIGEPPEDEAGFVTEMAIGGDQ